MARQEATARGIQWSAPVLVKEAAGGLSVTLPERVVQALGLGAGDVLNFTELPGGSIEVWMVPKSTYANLDAMAATEKGAAKKAVKKQAAGKTRRAGGKR